MVVDLEKEIEMLEEQLRVAEQEREASSAQCEKFRCASIIRIFFSH